MSTEQNHLWGAYSSVGIGADEVNGPGINWWVDALFPPDGEEVFTPLVMSHIVDLWGDVDVRIPGESRDITIPPEPNVFQVR